MTLSARAMPPLVWLALAAGCHPTAAGPDTAKAPPDAAQHQADFAISLAAPAAGWSCCFEPMSTCTQGANTRWQKDADETPTLVVHCSEGSHPVFCQDSKIGLICTTTEQSP